MADKHQAQAYPLRLPDELKERVAESAKRNGRSLNAEIVARLQASLDGGAGLDSALLVAKKDHEITAMELKHQLLLDQTRNFASRTKDVLEEAVDALGDLGDEVRGPLESTISALDDLHYDARELAQLEGDAARRRIADLVSAAEEAAKRYDQAVVGSVKTRGELPVNSTSNADNGNRRGAQSK